MSLRSKWISRLRRGVALLVFAAVPGLVCQLFAEPPQDRNINMESFRYGKEPSMVRVNRGDRLRMTFSTRDTGHSFFLEEFDVHAAISPGGEVQLLSTLLPEESGRAVKHVDFTADRTGLARYLVSKYYYRCHTWCGPMHAFEHGALLVLPNTLLWSAMGLLVGIPVVGFFGVRAGIRRGEIQLEDRVASDRAGWDIFQRLPFLKRLMQRRGFQFSFQVVAMVLLYVVAICALFGSKVAGRNLGIMLLWVVWLFLLTAVLTPLGGRIWCMACPLPMLGEACQRMAMTEVRTGSTRGYNNRFFGLNLRWPKFLSNAWLRTLAFLAMGTFSTALVAVPKVTGYVLLGMVGLAILMSLIWELRAFCRYICPISAFAGLYSMSGRLALRSKDTQVCADCRVQTCQNGNARGWACPYGLCVRDVHENTDCGLCTECIKSCSYDNISLRWRPFAQDAGMRSLSEAYLAIAMLVLAVSYCVVHLGHWPAVRDWVDIVDENLVDWSLFAKYAAGLWLVALAGVPALMLILSRLGRAICGAASRPEARLGARELFVATCGALVPIGLMAWIAFVIPMLLVNMTFVFQSINDPMGRNWDLFHLAGLPWHQIWPGTIPWMQVICIAAGLGYSLRNAWRVWLSATGEGRSALRGMLPLAVALVALSGWFMWFFAN